MSFDKQMISKLVAIYGSIFLKSTICAEYSTFSSHQLNRKANSSMREFCIFFCTLYHNPSLFQLSACHQTENSVNQTKSVLQ